LILGLAVVTIPVMTSAQDSGLRVRGTIERVEGDTYIISTRSGGQVEVKLADSPLVVAVTKATLSDIKPGSYVGVSAMPQADGSQKALEVHIFPESMRGVGDGHRGWDLQPSSTMTNGSVEQSAISSDGQALTLKYKDGEKKVVVPSDVPVVAYVPGDRSELKPGARIFIAAAMKQAGGKLQAARINVGRGVNPPM
jgi:hypothetical protein